MFSRRSRSRSGSPAPAAGSRSSAAARSTWPTPPGRSSRRSTRSAARTASWVAFTVANDGITLVTSKQNTWANCLTTAELKKVWNTGSKVDNWKDVRASFPDVPLKLFGPGTDSGTFDFFTEFINGKAKASRSDYTAREDDNILVQGVSGTRGGLGYFGFPYFEANQSRLNDVAVDAGAGLRQVVQGHGSEPDVQAALAWALHLREAGLRSSGPQFDPSSATR